jgi:acetyltransferase-like isoleucine patch superfamily enzyme
MTKETCKRCNLDRRGGRFKARSLRSHPVHGLFRLVLELLRNPFTEYCLYLYRLGRGKLRWRGFRQHYLATWSDCQFEPNVTLFERASVFGSTIGRHTYVGARSTVIHANVGRFCSIGVDCHIGGGRHPTHFVSTHPIFYSPAGHTGPSFADRSYYQEHLPVRIGHDVWIGGAASVLDGVEIGDGAVIGAGAVVTRPVESYSIVAGVPARLVRKRFDDETIRALGELRWWERDDAWLRAHFLELHDVASFVKRGS